MPPLPHTQRLVYDIQQASVSYRAQGRRRLTRTVSLTLQYMLQNENGRLITEDRCTTFFEDAILRADKEAVDSHLFPETQSTLPESGLTRRFVEPVILASAVTVMAYLFFSIRSRQE
jgi:hypothetical protein